MNGEEASYSADREGGAAASRMTQILREALGQTGVPIDMGERGSALDRLAETNLLLLGFFLDMERGMEEFLRAYGLPGRASRFAGLPAEEVARRLVGGGDPAESLQAVRERIQELKVHHAGLLEGYHEAAQSGTRRLLDELDPESMRKEYAGSSIRVGPLKLSSRLRPVMMQVVWEEFLRRFAQLRALAPADYERFFRDGFRRGYQSFRDARLGRSAPAPENEEP